ncbi:unnamed protein product [Vitrella brassicaformis CCMP3155]|uniref:Uncharacterized protein n=1 Tax=Vitrella brassicaformis (strain CCMP3155) TaxID=1169540 RepID=A0A0G4FCY6_VITBC|nr:unnamed protein product [Vitrella brassicaformis CCMP3155]|eukprot:CEM11031.1 unnamed protein product [Vitrella brassicaformis CCMP3155]
MERERQRLGRLLAAAAAAAASGLGLGVGVGEEVLVPSVFQLPSGDDGTGDLSLRLRRRPGLQRGATWAGGEGS